MDNALKAGMAVSFSALLGNLAHWRVQAVDFAKIEAVVPHALVCALEQIGNRQFGSKANLEVVHTHLQAYPTVESCYKALEGTLATATPRSDGWNSEVAYTVPINGKITPESPRFTASTDILKKGIQITLEGGESIPFDGETVQFLTYSGGKAKNALTLVDQSFVVVPPAGRADSGRSTIDEILNLPKDSSTITSTLPVSYSNDMSPPKSIREEIASIVEEKERIQQLVEKYEKNKPACNAGKVSGKDCREPRMMPPNPFPRAQEIEAFHLANQKRFSKNLRSPSTPPPIIFLHPIDNRTNFPLTMDLKVPLTTYFPEGNVPAIRSVLTPPKK